MEVRLRYFDGCPNWRAAHDRLQALGIDPVLERDETTEEAERVEFVGSPTILIDGRDVFPTSHASFGLTCRVYATPDGLAGSPTTEQLRSALAAAGVGEMPT